MDWYEVLSLVLGAAATVLALLNIRLVILALKGDHERRMKQATIETAGPVLREARKNLDAWFKFGAITSDDLARIHADANLEAELRATLGTIEHLAIGAHAGVYDKDLLYRMSASYIVSLFERVTLYVQDVRAHISMNAYTEFERLAVEFKQRKGVLGTLGNEGDIRFANLKATRSPNKP